MTLAALTVSMKIQRRTYTRFEQTPSNTRGFQRMEKTRLHLGDADCCQFAAYVAKKITGIDYVSAFKYDSEDEAQRIIDNDGGLSALLTRVLGTPSDERADGDPVLVDIR